MSSSVRLLFSIFVICSSTIQSNEPPLFLNILPADIVGLTAQYMIRNSNTIPEVTEVHTLLTRCKLTQNKATLEEFKSFIKLHGLGSRNAPDYLLNSLLLDSVFANNIPLTQLLLFIGADKEYIGIYHKNLTLLALAAKAGYINMTAFLLKHGANPNPHKAIPLERGKPIPASPLLCAIKGNTRNTAAIVKLLLDAGAERNLPDAHGQTPSSFLKAHPHFSNAHRVRELLENYSKKH